MFERRGCSLYPARHRTRDHRRKRESSTPPSVFFFFFKKDRDRGLMVSVFSIALVVRCFKTTTTWMTVMMMTIVLWGYVGDGSDLYDAALHASRSTVDPRVAVRARTASRSESIPTGSLPSPPNRVQPTQHDRDRAPRSRSGLR